MSYPNSIGDHFEMIAPFLPHVTGLVGKLQPEAMLFQTHSFGDDAIEPDCIAIWFDKVDTASSIFANKDCIGICDTDNAPSLRMEANARVMAAALTMLAALKRYIADYDEENPPDDMPDAGCIECTVGTAPNNRNTGLCKYHQAREAIAKAEGGAA